MVFKGTIYKPLKDRTFLNEVFSLKKGTDALPG